MADHHSISPPQSSGASSPSASSLVLPPSSSHSVLENVHTSPTPAPNGAAVNTLQPRIVYLKDHVTQATIYPIASPNHIAIGAIDVLHNEFNTEISRGNTYPMEEQMDRDMFVKYWFGTFAAVMILGRPEDHGDLTLERDWSSIILGTFYVKPNYPGRSSHVANGGFLTTFPARSKGCGRLMGEAYIDYAHKLGFTYSLFNLVYENNIASCKIWDSLGFKRLTTVPGAGRLENGGGMLTDAIVYGRDLKDDDDWVSDERFDKIKFYLEKGKYPPNADRSEKSRLRSAATHYRIVNGALMLKDKEVISDTQRQYEIAKEIHSQSHGGINKTTAHIAEKYHWVRIKETVSAVIKNCVDCKEHGKVSGGRDGRRNSPRKRKSVTPPQQVTQQLLLEQQTALQNAHVIQQHQAMNMSVHPMSMAPQHSPMMTTTLPTDATRLVQGINIPVDPQMMDGVEHHDTSGFPAHQQMQFVQHLQGMQPQLAQLPQQSYPAPVAHMHTPHQMDHGLGVGLGDNTLTQQDHVAIEISRAALNQGAVSLVSVSDDVISKDRQLMETLQAELKREERYGEEEAT